MTNVPMTQSKADVIESVLIAGDLSKLTGEQRTLYYNQVCKSLGLNPFTRPFQYIMLNGRLTLYASKDCTEQLRDKRKVSITKLEREKLDGIYLVTASAQTADGRQDSSIGAVNIEGLKGDALANAMMKAETKAKRRVTLSICGLGWADESEIETIPGAKPITVDSETGEIEAPAEPHWSDKMSDGKNWGEVWVLKMAQARQLSTGEVVQLVGDLHQYATHEAATKALADALAKV